MHKDSCAVAASSGHLDALKLLHECGGKLSHSTIRSAAECWHADCFKYLLDNGCPINVAECMEVTFCEEIKDILVGLAAINN